MTSEFGGLSSAKSNLLEACPVIDRPLPLMFDLLRKNPVCPIIINILRLVQMQNVNMTLGKK